MASPSAAPTDPEGGGGGGSDAAAAELRPPGAAALLREALCVFDVAGMAFAAARIDRLPRCDGARVITFPGFGFGDEPMVTLRMQLRALGAEASGWDLGRNNGRVGPLLTRARERVTAAWREGGRPVTLIGWSLGGYLAREVARELPDAVRRVVTLATPVRGGPRYTVFRTLYERLGYDLERIERQIEARRSRPLAVPVTAFYSRRDGIVAWRACLARDEPLTEHLAVKATHFGMCYAPSVTELIAERLAADAASAATSAGGARGPAAGP